MLVMILPMLSLTWLITTSLASPAAAVSRADAGCSFHLATSGAFTGNVGQLSSGQLRAGSSITPSTFTWFGDAFVDQQTPTTVLQCDTNQPPDHGFAIDCNGQLSFNGQSNFYECSTGDGDQVNIYDQQPSGANCSQITMSADSCKPPSCGGAGAGAGPNPTGANTLSTSFSGPMPTPFTIPPTQTPTTSASPVTSSSPCTVVSPVQIILTDKGNPDTAYGPNSQMNIQISPNASSIFNFHFADSDVGKTCELFFTISPGNTFYLTGTGVVYFGALDGWANPNTTFSTSPAMSWPLQNVYLSSGMTQTFGEFDCPGSTAQTSIIMMEAPMSDTCFDCIEGSINDQIGLYLSIC
ncbi:ubiquitin 3 binding protein But2 C-terminal domain-containing protein [Xylariaceae sp. FL0016]|nr:ubiquitin 3 binding protein But2 C-terminal domain-containing protein [Xylariaceae sp. FL0016]